MRTHLLSFFIVLILMPFSVFALEYPIGKPRNLHGMEIGAIYLQAVVMKPNMGLTANKADIHLEADIHALEDNPNGFPPGAWMPYLGIHYELTRAGSNQSISGEFHPMVASDGPHYGANVKLSGPGRYHLKYTITPPNCRRHAVHAPC